MAGRDGKVEKWVIIKHANGQIEVHDPAGLADFPMPESYDEAQILSIINDLRRLYLDQ